MRNLRTLLGRQIFLFGGAGFRGTPVQQAAQQESLKDPAPDRTAEESADEESPKRSFLLVLVRFLVVILFAEHAGNAGFKSFLKGRLNFFDLIFTDKPR